MFFKRSPINRPSTPDDSRAYVVGDIHGCLKKLNSLLDKIQLDMEDSSSVKDNFIVFLGDIIDRGPESKNVVERLINFKPKRLKPIFLLGNHEDIFLQILDGREDKIEPWLSFGGRSTAHSYEVDNLGAIYHDIGSVLSEIQQKVPKAHKDFIGSFSTHWVFGDYLCVHAGLRPKRPLAQQTKKDLLWIREPFLKYKGKFEYTVIHGHSIVEGIDIKNNRIAIDTGAYRGGMLSCLRIEGGTLKTIQSIETSL